MSNNKLKKTSSIKVVVYDIIQRNRFIAIYPQTTRLSYSHSVYIQPFIPVIKPWQAVLPAVPVAFILETGFKHR